MRTFLDPNLVPFDDCGDQPARQAPPEAVALAGAMVALNDAAERLERARNEAPDYTGQYSREYFYRSEQDQYYRAAEVFADAVVKVVAVGLAPTSN